METKSYLARMNSSECASLCEGSTLKCAIGDTSFKMSFARSLGQTLVAAASTLAFCAAANLQFAPIVSSTAGTWKRWFKHIALGLAEPFYAFAYSVVSAFIMWYARSKLPGGKLRGWGQDVAIMLNCPLLIGIPAAYSEIVEPLYLDQKSRKSHDHVSVQDPKGGAENLASYLEMDLTEADIGAVESPIPQIPSRSRSWIDDESTGISVKWMKGLQLESEEDIEEWHSAELPVKEGNYYAGDDDNAEGIASKKRYYIKLDPSPFHSREVHERFLLLQLELVPEYEQLRFLRSRSTFQSVVTTVQGLGYIFGVVQRILMPNQRNVSPLEAILCSFNVLVILQLLLNLYSCVHFQRPLLLRLNRLQFSDFCKAYRSQDGYSLLRYQFLDSRHSSKLFLCIGAFISLVSLAVIQFGFIHYALFYLHHKQKCLLCSLSSFIFCLLAVSAVILIGILNSKKFRELSAQAKLSVIIQIYSCIINTASIVLALVATIISWDMFNKPNINMLAWIVPHVAG